MTAAGALKFQGCCALVPVKSTLARRASLSIEILTLHHRAGVVGVGELAVLQHVEHAPHALLGIVLDVAHVGADRGEAELGHHLGELVGAALAARHLGLDVGHVLGLVADRPGAGAQHLQQGRLAQLAVLDQEEVVEQHALLVDVRAVGRHRARRDAADVGMVRARGGEEDQLLARRTPA